MKRPSRSLKLTFFALLTIALVGCDDGWESIGDHIEKRLTAVGAVTRSDA